METGFYINLQKPEIAASLYGNNNIIKCVYLHSRITARSKAHVQWHNMCVLIVEGSMIEKKSPILISSMFCFCI